MKTQLNMNKIAKGLGAESRGKVPTAGGGYFGAMQLLADIEARFSVPAGGGRPTDPHWTKRRLVPFAPRTLKHLEKLSAKIREHGGASIQPMQLAGLLLERTSAQLNAEEVRKIMGSATDFKLG